jgi:hypothetical protein
MGNLYRFKDLKIYGQKIFRMHQHEMLTKAKDYRIVDSSVAARVDKGMCATLTALWICEVLRNCKESAFRPHGLPDNILLLCPSAKWKEKKSDLKDRHAVLARIAAPKQHAYEKFVGKEAEKIVSIIPELVMGERKELSFLAVAGIEYTKDRAYYIEVKFSKGGHAIGMYGDAVDKMHFFDPNAGEYEIVGHRLSPFLDAYEKIITGMWGKITGVIIHAVRLRSTSNT